MQSLEFCNQEYIAYQEAVAKFNRTLTDQYHPVNGTREIPRECDPFEDRRYLQRISLALLVVSIVIQFIYG